MGYEYRIEVSAKRTDIEEVLECLRACQCEGDQFVYRGADPEGWPDATAQLDEKGIYFLANSSVGKSLLGNLLLALASLGPVKFEEL